LKHFHFDPERTDPREEACKDEQEYDVGEILDIRGINGNRKDQLEVKVRWKGYGPDKDSWLPWPEIRDVGLLHDYLKENDLRRLLPKYVRQAEKTK
jgi:hypothetical protein